MARTPSTFIKILILVTSAFLTFFLSACGSEWIASTDAPTSTSPAITVAETAVETVAPLEPVEDVTVLAEVDTPSVKSRRTQQPRVSATPVFTATSLAPEQQLATFYAEASLTATTAGTFGPGPRPTITRRPTATTTITPTPLPPSALLRVARPGRLSKLISPFRTEIFVRPGEDGRVHLDLIGEDGRYITRQLLDYSRYKGKSIGISPQIDFQIEAVAETARLVVTINDNFGRRMYLSSVDLILLSIGENEINMPGGQPEPYLVRSPKPGELVSGGVVLLAGLARPVNEGPIIFELVDETGKIVGSQRINLPAPTGNLSHTPFTVDIPYQIEDITPVRLTIRQESSTRIAGTVALSSQELTLAP